MARQRRKAQVPFPYKLVLHQWLLGLYGVETFDELAAHLRSEGLEGLDENNVYRFHHALTAQLFNRTHLSTDKLLEYDNNIVRHTQALNEFRAVRGAVPTAWKYFQYLALLSTEVYLDWYFNKPDELRAALNERIAKYNDGLDDADRLQALAIDEPAWAQLNKLAFWMATGSGKTLLMHVHIKQYLHYLEKAGRLKELNRIILLTPNEGLSQQHLREFDAVGIEAELFTKQKGPDLFRQRPVEILEVTRLRDEAGVKSVAVDAFEGNNLVLIDEGHRGASAGEEGAWMKARNKLCANGFSFEYSATFQQAVAGKQALIEVYSKSILCNYSYRYFYADGFGKDYQILNLDEETSKDYMERYLVACLLTFFQQLWLHRKHAKDLRAFHIDKPLWIFVGGSVTATLAKHDASDIVEIIQFFTRYIDRRTASIAHIKHVLDTGLITTKGKNLFAGRFKGLIASGLTPEAIYQETLTSLFNATAGGQLTVELLKGVPGEIALRVGAENLPFGVINVGEAPKLVKLCETNGITTGEREFSASLFHEINQSTSTVNVLVGSKKFTEGWSSWRVSTMGLMNVGKSEGAQIIQLFGRGVRLKGYGISLKRSSKAALPEDVKRPDHLATLETLGIFGIHAKYMAEFREFLKDEGMPDNEEQTEILLPVIKNLGTRKLRTIRLKKTINGVSTEFGKAFRDLGPVPTLNTPPAYIQENQIVLNRYPKIDDMESMTKDTVKRTLHETYFRPPQLAFLNFDQLYLELERFKAERGWYNLNLPHGTLRTVLADASWYRVQIPEDQFASTRYENVARWQDIALALLKKYVERYYTYSKREWEMPHLEYQDLTADDPNMLGIGATPDAEYYRILVDQSQTEISDRLKELKAFIEKKEAKTWEFQGLKAIWFQQHLYQPLLYMKDKLVELSPVALNLGESRFVDDLKKYHDGTPAYFKDKELYVLRNLSKGRGIGFFEAGNFYPDFILWLLVGDVQHVLFVDPKGIRNLSATDPKIEFYRTIKQIETRLGDPSVRLHSFIISNTHSEAMKLMWGTDKATMQTRHVLFQEDDDYVAHLFTQALLDSGPTFSP